jgi:calcineurin-like phosphoesterase family protein
MRRTRLLVLAIVAVAGSAAVLAQQRRPVDIPSKVRPIQAPARPLASEEESAGVTQFSFFAYGDTRSLSGPDGDGQVRNPEHARVVDLVLSKAKSLASTPFPARFVVQSGDAVLRGASADMWNVSFTPLINRLTGAGLPYFFTVGNHDVSGMPVGDLQREAGLSNTLAAISNLIPAEGSPRRLKDYPTYAFGYGNAFLVFFDSNIASDPLQFAWVQAQIEHLDRTRYPHIVAVFHHPIYSSGPHGGKSLEPATIALRTLYMPMFRRNHVRLLITGHDHLFDHFVELYDDQGVTYRMDQIVTGGGGAPIYVYDGEPNLDAYVAAGSGQHVRVQHLTRPGRMADQNPHHFVIVQIDGDKLAAEIVGTSGAYRPYNGRARIDLQ